jgi:Fe-S-cluster containining protein
VSPPRKTVSLEKAVAQLCPRCALCCNGVIFKDVELQTGDDAVKLKSLGLPLSKIRRISAIGNQKFPQPCVALDGSHCRVYADRPSRCRQFECSLLKSVLTGRTEVAVAYGVIQQARQRADQVLALLRECGDENETLALSLRFKRVKKKFEASPPDDVRAETFSRLTLAVHDLNLLLGGKFYP